MSNKSNTRNKATDNAVDPLKNIKSGGIPEELSDVEIQDFHPVWMATFDGALRHMLTGQSAGSLVNPKQDAYLRSSLMSAFRLADIAQDVFEKRKDLS